MTITAPTYSVHEYRRYTRATQWLNGTGAAIAIALGVFILVDPARRTDPDWVFWLIWPIATLHTIEEYLWPGGFLKYFNAVAWRSGDPHGPLTARRAFFTDAVAGLFNPIAVLALSIIYLPAVWFFVGVLLINGFFHLVETLKTGRYFPGALTGALLYLPGFTAITMFYVNRGLVTGLDLAVMFAVATVFTAGFFAMVRSWQRRDERSPALVNP
ncbi:HXXEE domain-containing protein [Mycolicibacterium iranicum]|uniref:HXXEE domain-containing protein n=1 Tax=Mycolicibacterium iranicum TaxID=912594 RepID=UPI000464FA21|nr:HXXEE domain-containing protein [Mycolicibacterium iranicum]